MRTDKKHIQTTTRSTKQLEKVIKQFENWRAVRKKRERIPEHLWDAAVSLCNDHSVSKIKQILRIDYNKLKRKVLAAQNSYNQSSNNRKKGERRDSISFMDISLPIENMPYQKKSGASSLIELYHVNGTSMRIIVPGMDSTVLSDILSTFLSSV